MSPPSVIILGAGPAGCTLAALLAKRGVSVLVFDDEKRPPLLVGESLIPAVVNLFRLLEIEDRVKQICTHKPGAAFFCTSGEKLFFNFRSVEGHLPPYSYNAPRPELDNLLRTRAEELGARFVKARAEVSACEIQGQPSVQLSAESRAAAGLAPGAPAPLLVDASGRARTFARAMQLPAQRGPRNDVAYFAHFEDFDHDEVEPGNIIISVLRAGWSWRIPLPGRLSVGIVVNKEHAATLGSTPEERLLTAIKEEPLLREKGKRARRVSEVMTYTNYQLLSERGYGPGWVLLGDAFGFVDPMLSPGLFMSMEGGRMLDEVLRKAPSPGPAQDKLLAAYSAKVMDWHSSWTDLVEYFYDGNIFRAYMGGQQFSQTYSGQRWVRYIERFANFQIASMASGGRTCSTFSKVFLKQMCKHVVRDVPPPERYAVRDAVQ